jgi:hypothetical protein
MTSVQVDILLVVVGALLGYLSAKAIGWQENRERRNLLLSTLKYELRRIKESFPAYDASRVFHRYPLRFATLDQLVQGNVLSYRKDGALLRELLLLRVVLAQYNDFVLVSNLTQNFGNMPDDVHREVFDIISGHHHLLREAKAQVLRALPSDVTEVGGYDRPE